MTAGLETVFQLGSSAYLIGCCQFGSPQPVMPVMVILPIGKVRDSHAGHVSEAADFALDLGEGVCFLSMKLRLCRYVATIKVVGIYGTVVEAGGPCQMLHLVLVNTLSCEAIGFSCHGVLIRATLVHALERGGVDRG